MIKGESITILTQTEHALFLNLLVGWWYIHALTEIWKKIIIKPKYNKSTQSKDNELT